MLHDIYKWVISPLSSDIAVEIKSEKNIIMYDTFDDRARMVYYKIEYLLILSFWF